MFKIPNLKTLETDETLSIAKQLLAQKDAIESWFEKQWQQVTPPFYSSVDLRHAGFKLAPVDTNLFPAGFNNLDEAGQARATEAIRATLQLRFPEAKRILLIPDSDARNPHYFENVRVLENLVKQAGYEVKIGSLLSVVTEPRELKTPGGHAITLYPVKRDDHHLHVDGFEPDLIVLNYDLAGGVADTLRNLKQPVIPSLSLGWHQRLKSGHFQHYEAIAADFGKEFDIDPWLISPLFRYCGEIDFMSRAGEDCIEKHAKVLFASVKEKYKEHNIKKEPFLAIKADAGSFGMAVMMIKDPEDIHRLNRKQRLKMAVTKGGATVSNVIIQEGVYSEERFGKNNSATAEPVVYCIGEYIAGAFYRMHGEQESDENLNIPGMEFKALKEAKNNNAFYVYSVVARLAALAAAYED